MKAGCGALLFCTRGGTVNLCESSFEIITYLRWEHVSY